MKKTILKISIILLVLTSAGARQEKLKILIIGDSISIGYTPFVKESLKDVAEVYHNPGNAQHTGKGLQYVEAWITAEDFDIIQFNWGLWDMCYRHPDSEVQGQRDKINGTVTFSPEDYENQLRAIVKILKEKSDAELIFVTTSYVPQSEPGRFSSDPRKYNNIAKQVMKENGIKVNDINHHSVGIHAKYGKGDDDVHYHPDGYQALGKYITAFLKNNIEETKSGIKTIAVNYSAVSGIGQEKGVMRRDPSDIIRVGDLYYVWYSKGPQKTGYDATVWYATSPDGLDWTEQGMALGKGEAGSWEFGSVFTPNILVAEGRYWLFYSGVSTNYGKGFQPDSKIGIAVANSPNGPWEKLGNNPILGNSKDPEAFDSYLIDDACLVAREGKYFFYYKGRKVGETPHYTKMGVAIADKPQGPYVKYEGNPIIKGNHAVLVWPQGDGVAAMIDGTGPADITRSVLYAADGLNFDQKLYKIDGPVAAGAYRPENFVETKEAKPINWGLEIRSNKGSLPFLHRYDIVWE